MFLITNKGIKMKGKLHDPCKICATGKFSIPLSSILSFEFVLNYKYKMNAEHQMISLKFLRNCGKKYKCMNQVTERIILKIIIMLNCQQIYCRGLSFLLDTKQLII